MTNKTLTVFTPAYNRAHTIGRTYESLCRQTSKDFCWLVIDDGSMDNTGELVRAWKEEGKIDITYIHQQNQGMHGAHNTAYRNINTELCTCIDSDDFMPENAVNTIIDFWNKNHSDKYAGIIGLDVDMSEQVIGDKFIDSIQSTTLSGYYENGGKGDKKLVYRTDIIKNTNEYPLFEGERYVGLSCRCLEIDQSYEFLVINEPLVIVDYQEDGSSMSMYKQYWNNPKGFAYFRKHKMMYSKSLKVWFEESIHYVSSSIRAKNKAFLKESPKPIVTFLMIPFGVALYFYIKSKVKRGDVYKVKKS
ncbi:MAG: glycosyltransferase family 2 protein [Rikenellaceae bacterium]